MREIKFRGKRIDTGEWVTGHYFISPLTDENSGTDPKAGWFFLTGELRHCIEHDGIVYIIEPHTLGQLWFVHPETKIEIYEGDIVRNKWHDKCRVEWDEEYGSFCTMAFDGDVNGEQQFYPKDIIEIIGSIHDTAPPPNNEKLKME